MSSSQLARDLLIALIAGVPAMILALIAWRKMPAEVDAAQANADRAQHDATKSIAEGAQALAESLRAEIVTLKQDLAATRSELAAAKLDQAAAETRAKVAEKLGEELKERLTKAEARLAQSESRAADAEKRAMEFRSDLIKVGTAMGDARREHQQQIEELVLIIQSLLEQVEQLGGKPNIDRAVLDRIASLGRR